MIVAVDMLQTPADYTQLAAAVHSVHAEVGEVQRAMADSGYVIADEFDELKKENAEVFVAVTGEDPNKRKYDYRPHGSDLGTRSPILGWWRRVTR